MSYSPDANAKASLALTKNPVILETDLAGVVRHARGKVRDVYSVDNRLLIVATDRISAFDYVLGSGIPDKGKVLTQISCFWFERLRGVVPNHIVSTDPATFPEAARAQSAMLRGRSAAASLPAASSAPFGCGSGCSICRITASFMPKPTGCLASLSTGSGRCS